MKRLTTEEKYSLIKLLDTCSIDFISSQYHISVRTIYRWKSKFDGTLQSLENKPSIPHTYPSAHTDEEIKNIKTLIRYNPNIGLSELYKKLQFHYGYNRNIASLYRFLKRNGYYEEKTIRKALRVYDKERICKKFNDTYDVAVCGGGFAGISAALAAARNGKKVILFEKQYMLGGLGTSGLVTIYLPLCDGYGHQVSFGIAEELLKLSITYGAEADYPENWLDGIGTRTSKDKRYLVRYNAQLFALLAERLLIENGVDILYGSYVTDVNVDKQKITRLYVENKTGMSAYAVGSVVDATGDCDIAHFAYAPTDTFEQGNVLAAWYYYTNEKGYELQTVGAADIPDEEKSGNEAKPLIERRFTGLDGEEISSMMCLSHKATLENWLDLRKTSPSAVISTIATIPQIRMTRKLIGEYTLSHTEEHTYFEDSIGMVSNWKKRGPVYEIPFRTLFNKQVKNLIVAGRCTSVNETLWDVMRVIPCCAVTGQAAGTAAAMTNDFSALDVKELQKTLSQNGVLLHEKDIQK